jgi:tetratricopeptide (TPR) repeat protein
MSSVCPACGSEVRAGAKFCRACGSPLQVAQAVPAVPPAEAVPASGLEQSVVQLTLASSVDTRPAPTEAAVAAAPDVEAEERPDPVVSGVQPRPGEAQPVISRSPAQATVPLVTTPPPAKDRAPSVSRAAAPTRPSAGAGKRLPRKVVILSLAACLVVGGGVSVYFLGGAAWLWRSEAVPKEAKESVRRGVSLASEREYDKAIMEFTQAIAIHPKYGVAYANRGVAYIQKREYVKALDDLRKAAELSPRDRCRSRRCRGRRPRGRSARTLAA